ncbi:hypothetical protein [Streptomyces sp. NPDC055085]
MGVWVRRVSAAGRSDSEGADDAFLAFLESVATYVRKTGLSHAASLGSCIIVQRPDRLHDFTRLR